MQLNVLGVKRVFGVSAKTGADYDMHRLLAVTPIDNRTSPKYSVQGYGYELSEIELHPQALESFRDVKFPAVLELQTDVMPSMGELKTVVVGFKPIAKAVNG